MPAAANQYRMLYEGGGIMDALRQYIVSVIAAAILCSIFTGLINKGIVGDLIKLTCGVLLTVVLISPLADIKHFTLHGVNMEWSRDTHIAVSAGEKYSAEALSTIIKQETEAYILNKAKDLDLALSADVVLSRDVPPVPVEVYLSGAAAPLARQKLTEALVAELGIAKEKLIWTG